MLNQRLQQKLLQKLSPQQIQLMKLLQLPTLALEQRIKQEIEENPALEQESEEYAEDEYTEEKAVDEDDSPDEKEEYEIDLDAYFDDDDTPSYKYQINNRSADDENKQIPFAAAISFHEVISQQLGMRKLTDIQHIIGLIIIGNLDDSGYLQREIAAMTDDIEFSQGLHVDEKEILEVLSVIQDFDPPGVGARNLQECLQLQLQRIDETEISKNAITIISRYFNEFTKKHYERIMQRSGMSNEELKDAIDLILTLNPKPGNSISESSSNSVYIIPDFTISNTEGKLDLSLNGRNVPELRLSRSYLEMLEDYSRERFKNSSQQKDAIVFIKQKIESAKWFIDAIHQRQNTLLTTMGAIMNYQKEYFLSGDETKLKPMILKDIAEIVKLDISTISRVANSKYVQTNFGTFLIKSFFSESLQTDSGDEVSTREVKKILSNHIAAESKKKPLTDDELAKILRENGYNIARRTVAKYRDQLSIPVARLRKEL